MAYLGDHDPKEEARAATAAMLALGMELDTAGECCSYCQTPEHTKPDCPWKAKQEQAEADERKRRTARQFRRRR